MEKRVKWEYSGLIALVLFISLIFAFLVDLKLSGFAIFEQDDSSDFSGTFLNTFFNSSSFIQLNSTNLTGNYTSQILDAESTSTWNTISWISNINLGNVLSFYFNNDINLGEDSDTFFDFSGNENNGECLGSSCPTINSTISSFGKAYKFDGNNFISVPTSSSLNINDELTLEVWVKNDPQIKVMSIFDESARSDYANSILQTSDGGYILTGKNDTGISNSALWLAKLFPNGTKEWSKSFNFPGNHEDEGFSIQQTSDGGYIIAGIEYMNIVTYDQDILLLKVFSNGSEEWNRTFGNPRPQFSIDAAYSVKQTSDGGYILAGQSNNTTSEDMILIKTNSTGHQQWNRTFGGTDTDMGKSIKKTSDGGYIIAGFTNSFGNEGDMWIIKINSTGSEEWNRTFGGPDYSDIAYPIQQTSDGGYIIGGSINELMGIIKINSTGSEEWNKTFSGGSSLSIGLYDDSLKQTSDGGYVFVGNYFGGEQIFFVKTDSKGEIKPNDVEYSTWFYEGTSIPSNPSVIELNGIASGNISFQLEKTSDDFSSEFSTNTDSFHEMIAYKIVNKSALTRFNFSWEGSNSLGSPEEGVNLSIYNWTSGNWEIFESTSSSDESVIENQFIAGFSDYINNSIMWILVTSKGYASLCFLEGTQITLENGEMKNIEEITIGDRLLSYDEKNKKFITTSVIQTFEHSLEENFGYYLSINGNINVTPNHPLFVNEKWIPAGEIKLGDNLLGENGDNVKVKTLNKINSKQKVYNLAVNPDNNDSVCEEGSPGHTYFAEGILAHNKCPRIWSYNSTDYEFDSLINVGQEGKDKEKAFYFPLKNLAEPKIIMKYDPDEKNFVDTLSIRITDRKENETKVSYLKPISCQGVDFDCNLDSLVEIDENYILSDENHTEAYIEFEPIPNSLEGYEREIGIYSSGYRVEVEGYESKRYDKGGDNEEYILDFLDYYYNNLDLNTELPFTKDQLKRVSKIDVKEYFNNQNKKERLSLIDKIIRFILGEKELNKDPDESDHRTMYVDHVVVNMTPYNGDNILGNDGNSYEIQYSSNKIYGVLNGQDVSTNISDTNWHHVALRYNGSHQSLFLDGILRSSLPLSEDINSSNKNIKIGDGFEGFLDSVAIYNRSLSNSEILDNYRFGIENRSVNFSVRSCNDSECSGESFTDIADSSPIGLSLPNNRYFQYLVKFARYNSSYPVELNSVTLSYSTVSSGGNSSSGNSGNSGGGGGGEETVQNSTISTDGTIVKKSLVVNVKPNEETSVKSFDNTGVNEIIITVSKQIPAVSITVSKYESKPDEVSKEKSGKAYRYIQIEVENLNGSLEKAIVEFEVEKLWMTENDLEPDNVAVFKFNETSEDWNELPTNYSGEENESYLYIVELNSFSFFAIGEKYRLPIFSDIVETVTESYDIAKQRKYGLIIWWTIFGILLITAFLVANSLRNQISNIKKNRKKYEALRRTK